ncbi:MAG: right-handed parallel beta-helix repeat-containing protein [Bacteroidetes bacterium]|nr:right-handed parallel beta-helix repeat-containing protein [Bacteroidota bacterium]
MKKLLISFLVLIVSITGLNAKKYYFSSSGNDKYSVKQAQNPATPWKTLEKLNSIMNILEPGDSVLFRRGDVFVGFITITKSGSESRPIVFAAYGNKNKPEPEINGRIKLSNWAQFEKNIWVADASHLTNTVNYFTIDSKAYAMGRFPNADETPDGYMHIESADSTLSITDNELKGEPDWTGAELVIKPKRWLIDRNPITKHEGNTIWYHAFSRYVPAKGFGYFIQNHMKTLDRFGEWFYDTLSKKMYVYLGNKLPKNYTIQGSRFENLLEINNQSNIEIYGLSFVGANKNSVNLNNVKRIVVKNCTMKYSGLNGINGSLAENVLIENNKVLDVSNSGLSFMRGCSNIVVRSNTVKRCGIIDGTGPSGNSKTVGVSIGGENNLLEFNTIDSIGYIGLIFSGDNVLIKNNIISNFTMNKDDGGGIYTVSGKRRGRDFKNRKIIGNIVMHGIGNGAGTSRPEFKSAIGIYMDDGTSYVDIYDNIVGYCAEIGIFLHDARFINVKNNLAYNCDIPFAMHQDLIWEGGSMISNVIRKNIFVSPESNSLLESFRTQEDNIRNFGDLDSNYFWYASKSIEDSLRYFKETTWKSKYQNYSIEDWKKKYPFDQHSEFNEIDEKDFNKNIRIEYNSTRKQKNINLGTTVYKDIDGKRVTGKINLKPFEWIFLVKD